MKLLQDRCATTKVYSVRGVMEFVRKGCQKGELCGPASTDPGYTGQCDSGRQREYVRCIKCDYVTPGTCQPAGAALVAERFYPGIGLFICIAFIIISIIQFHPEET